MLKVAWTVFRWAGWMGWIVLALSFSSVVPIILPISVTAWQEADGDVVARIVTRKVLPCHLIEGTSAGYVQVEGVWRKVDIEPPTPLVYSPPGEVLDRNWRWRGAEPARVEEAVVILHYMCSGTLRDAAIGPFPVRPKG